MHRVAIPLAKLGSTYKGGAFSGPSAVHPGSLAISLRWIDQIPRVRGERRAMPLLTSTTVGQGSDKSAEKGYGETWVMTGMNHGKRGARSHSADLTPEQERSSRAQSDINPTRVALMGSISIGNTSATMHK